MARRLSPRQRTHCGSCNLPRPQHAETSLRADGEQEAPAGYALMLEDRNFHAVRRQSTWTRRGRDHTKGARKLRLRQRTLSQADVARLEYVQAHHLAWQKGLKNKEWEARKPLESNLGGLGLLLLLAAGMHLIGK